jgi:hypothetical protein
MPIINDPGPDQPFDEPAPTAGPVPRRPPYTDRPTISGFWLPAIIGALVILGLIFWFSSWSHRGTTTAYNAGPTTTTTEKVNPPTTQPPVSQPPAAQPPATNP